MATVYPGSYAEFKTLVTNTKATFTTQTVYACDKTASGGPFSACVVFSGMAIFLIANPKPSTFDTDFPSATYTTGGLQP